MTLSPLRIRLGVLISVALLFVWIAFHAAGFPQRARTFPQTIALLGLVMAVLKILLLLRSDDQPPVQNPTSDDVGAGTDSALTLGEEWRRAVPYVAAFAGYGFALVGIGFYGASFLFMTVFLRLFDKASWQRAILSAGLFTIGLAGLSSIIDLELPGGILGLR